MTDRIPPTERLPPLNALRAFECASRHLSFTRAAQELNVTQAAVSHQVKGLEEHLGFKLFRRLNKSLLLTDAGQAYGRELGEAFALIRQATQQARSHETSAPITVSLMPSFASRWLVPRLGRFRAAHPDIDLLIDPNVMPVDLTRGTVDVAIRYGMGSYPELLCERLMSETLFPVCAPQLLEGAHGLSQPLDLNRFHLLHDDDHSYWQAWLNSAEVDGIDVNRGTVFTDSAMLLAAAIDGLGVAIGRSVLVNDALASGALVRPFKNALTSQLAYYTLTLPERSQHPKLLAFRQWLLREAAQTPAD